jgi:methylmalonyl-CoA/ethylmalonyl-CoA epimerase
MLVDRMRSPSSLEAIPVGSVKLHHIGFVLASIEESAEAFAQSLCASWDGKIIFDPLQNVHVTFLRGAHANDALIELVEPGSSDSPVSRFLARGGGMHHVCYEVEDLEAQLAFCKTVNSTVVRKPVPAVAFDGRRIAWVLTKRKLLVEYLESSRSMDGSKQSS